MVLYTHCKKSVCAKLLNAPKISIVTIKITPAGIIAVNWLDTAGGTCLGSLIVQPAFIIAE